MSGSACRRTNIPGRLDRRNQAGNRAHGDEKITRAERGPVRSAVVIGGRDGSAEDLDVAGSSGSAAASRGSVATTRVLICDELPVRRQFVLDLARAMPELGNVVDVADGQAVVAAYAAQAADLVLIGVHGGPTVTAGAAQLLLGRFPAAAVIVYGSAIDAAQLVGAVAGGARGWLLRDPQARIHHNALPGTTAASAGAPAVAALTEREMQVLYGMSNGQSNSEIGKTLSLAEDTVKSHARRLFVSLAARDRAHAVAIALRSGLLE